MAIVPDQSFLHPRDTVCRSRAPRPGAWEVRFDIDFVALTSNNVTHAVAGDLLDYWGFFLVSLPWGHARDGPRHRRRIGERRVEEGARHFGFFPMADQHIVLATGTDAGLFDIGVHRAPHATAYQFADSGEGSGRGTLTGKHVALLRDSSSRRGWPRICCSTMTILARRHHHERLVENEYCNGLVGSTARWVRSASSEGNRAFTNVSAVTPRSSPTMI